MGDRCYLQVTIHGYIDNLAVLEEVIEAIQAEGLDPASEGIFTDNIVKEFAHALAFEMSPTFACDEKNYANIDELETVLKQYGIAYAVYHGSGDSYGPGRWVYEPPGSRYQATLTHDGSIVLDLEAVKHAINSVDPVVATRQLIHEAEMASGDHLPKFSVGEELKRHLATIMGVEALSPQTV